MTVQNRIFFTYLYKEMEQRKIRRDEMRRGEGMMEEELNYGNMVEQKKGRQIRRKCRFVNDRKMGNDLCRYISVREIGSPCNVVWVVIQPAISLLFLAAPFFCRSQWPCGLRPLVYWDCGFESHRRHNCLSCDCCVLPGRGLCDCPTDCGVPS